MFSKYVSDQLKYYVYRLIDPRNGDTFYVGKGTGNRIFAHIRGELNAGEEIVSQKIHRIRQIRKDGFEIGHVIHRHGLTEEQALEVEAALIDAYPAATNLVGGIGSDERGLMHAQQIIERYEARPAVFRHKVILINVNRSIAGNEDIYSAVRWAWKLDPRKARQAEVVLAVEKGLIIGAFIAEKWMEATVANFPGKTTDRPGRWGFVGREASEDVKKLYLRHRLPDSMRRRGAANPVRYAA